MKPKGNSRDETDVHLLAADWRVPPTLSDSTL